jgi:hypothetical protein
MNRERLKQLADALRAQNLRFDNHSVGFNMSVYHYEFATDGRPDGIERKTPRGNMPEDCGSVACIAGWTELMFKEPKCPFHSTHRKAAYILELTEDEAGLLFCPSYEVLSGGYRESIPLSHAVAVLEHAAETGIIDWSI